MNVVAHSTIRPEGSLPNTSIFSRHITAFLHLTTLDGASALHLGLFETVKSQQNAQKCEKHGTERFEGHLFMRVKTRKQSIASLDISWKRAH